MFINRVNYSSVKLLIRNIIVFHTGNLALEKRMETIRSTVIREIDQRVLLRIPLQSIQAWKIINPKLERILWKKILPTGNALDLLANQVGDQSSDHFLKFSYIDLISQSSKTLPTFSQILQTIENFFPSYDYHN